MTFFTQVPSQAPEGVCAPQGVQDSLFCGAQLQSKTFPLSLLLGRWYTVYRTGQRLNVYFESITQNYGKGMCTNYFSCTHRSSVQRRAGGCVSNR